MTKKQYQKPSFISKVGKNTNIAPGALAAAAGVAVGAQVKKALGGSYINEEPIFSLTPIRRVGV